MNWCLRCGGSYGFRPIDEHVCSPHDIAREELRGHARAAFEREVDNLFNQIGPPPATPDAEETHP